jgi:hypothetical protein
MTGSRTGPSLRGALCRRTRCRREQTAAPPPPSPQRRLILSPSPSFIPSRRDMLPRTGRSCALMCDITPDNARQEMLHARPRRDSLQVCPRRLRLQLGQRRRAPAQWRLGHDASPLPARPAPDIRAVKRSPRSTRACDPRAPPRWHGCLQVRACQGKKKILCVLLNFVANIFCHRLPRVSGGARTLHERSPAAGVLSRAPQGACTTLLPCDRFHQLPEFGRWAPVGH